jgi:hypothetical protein
MKLWKVRQNRKDDAVISSVVEFMQTVAAHLADWERNRPAGEPAIQPWFRGEPVVREPLLPKLYRGQPPHREVDLLQHFRNMAVLPQFNAGMNRESTDLWLFLAQHAGLPTRLLDWTEGALIALYFAVHKDRQACVWMLFPQGLNFASGVTGFELPWSTNTRTAAVIRAAWQREEPEEPDLPIALYPMHVHPRLQVQRSCFTIQGRRKKSLNVLMAESRMERFIRPIEINPTRHRQIWEELGVAGISQATLFPDLDGLAGELSRQFWQEKAT